jgi:two-component system chemotaxis response regulator CheY
MKSCLLVDDSRVVRMVARKIMEALSFSCDEAENGRLAVEKCAAAMPDFILLDWNMPVMNGIEFLQELRQMPNGDTPKVVLCTTENDMAHIQQALMAGADEYIMKPFDNDIMQDKLSQVGLL